METPLTRDEPTPPPYRPRPDVLRLVAAVLAFATAVIGLVEHYPHALIHRAARVPPVYADASLPSPLYKERSACFDEIRLRPTDRWRCRSWVTAFKGQPIVAPRDEGGPCTHRTVDFGASSWDCWTRVPLPASVLAHGDPHHPIVYGGVRSMKSYAQARIAICVEEIRTGGRWGCLSEQEVRPDEIPAEATDPGGPCTLRVVDQGTGFWSCRAGATPAGNA